MLGRIGIRKWLGPDAAIEVEYVSGIRDWKSWPLISKNKLISRFWTLFFSSGSIDLHIRAGPCSVSLQAFQSTSDLLRRFAWWCFGLAQLHVPLETRPVCDSLLLVQFSLFFCIGTQQLNLEDLPRNVVVSSSGRGARGERHPLDVVVLVKRFAADQELCQESWLNPLLNHSFNWVFLGAASASYLCFSFLFSGSESSCFCDGLC